jgi:hypothetical protein
MALRKKPDDVATARPAVATRGAKNPARVGGAKSERGRGGAKADGSPSRLKQIWLVFKITRERDPQVIWIILGSLLGPLAIGVVGGLFLGPIWVWVPLGLLLGLLLALNLFSRRVQRSAYAEMEGKPGAAAGIIERMRGDWRLTPAVGVNRNQDIVHRVVSRAGVVVVAEGRGRGARDLLAAEMRRVRKVAGDAPITDIVVGDGDGEVPLQKLQPTLMRLRRTLRKGEVDALDRRLKAVTGPTLPIPKGPLPRNVPRGGRPR